MDRKPGPTSLYVSTVAILSALMAVLAYASVVIPTPLGSYDASSVLIFVTSILYGPAIGVAVTCIGQLIGKGLLITYAGLPAIYIPGAVAVRGVEAGIVGVIGRRAFSSRQVREALAMIIGVLWETAGFVVADFYLYSMIGGVAGGLAAISFTMWTIVDLIWVPIGILAVTYARVAFNAEYLDEELGLTGKTAKRGLLLGSLALLLICWVFIVIAGLTGLFMGPVFP